MQRQMVALAAPAAAALLLPPVLRLLVGDGGPLWVGLGLQVVAFGLVAALVPGGALGAPPVAWYSARAPVPADAVQRSIYACRRACLASVFIAGTAILLPTPTFLLAEALVVTTAVAVGIRLRAALRTERTVRRTEGADT